MNLFYDLTEFVRHPLRSGIPRVVHEVAAHWPASFPPLVPVQLQGEGLVRLPGETFTRMSEFIGDHPGNSDEARSWLLSLPEQPGTPITPKELASGILINTEMFDDWDRVDFYERYLDAQGGDRLFFLVYDMLPWVQPQWFHQSIITFPLGYVRLLRRSRHVAFISEQTRRDFLQRIMRHAADSGRLPGPVLSLGSDGLGMAAPEFRPESRLFTVIGTLEPRKNLMTVVDAFERLWASGEEVDLACAGRMGWLSDAEKNRIEKLTVSQPHFVWHADLADGGVRTLVRSSRATLYASHAEGFGLPPLESLALGVPVIVSGNLPSVQMIEPWGQVRLSVSDSRSVEQAVRSLLDDEVCRQKTEEIRKLRLPRWADLGREMAEWVRRVTQPQEDAGRTFPGGRSAP